MLCMAVSCPNMLTALFLAERTARVGSGCWVKSIYLSLGGTGLVVTSKLLPVPVDPNRGSSKVKRTYRSYNPFRPINYDKMVVINLLPVVTLLPAGIPAL